MMTSKRVMIEDVCRAMWPEYLEAGNALSVAQESAAQQWLEAISAAGYEVHPRVVADKPASYVNDLKRMLACAERELAMRRSVYKARVRMKQMRQETSDYEIESMEMIASHLRSMMQAGEPTERSCECEETTPDCAWNGAAI